MNELTRRTAISLGISTAVSVLLPASGGAKPAAPSATNEEKADKMQVKYRNIEVGNVDVFYREAGPENAPTILLLHGFPTSSHMFRDLIPKLATKYRVIAPDLPGFGNTRTPPRGQFAFTFDNLAKVIEEFTVALNLERYALYVFDYGAPTGFRLAVAHPEKVTAIISQNGNAYMDGFSDALGSWQAYWRDPSAENREACRESLSADTIRNWQYGTGAVPELLSPDGYTLDIDYMARPGAEEIQLDLIGDYKTNVDKYPEFQEYFRSKKALACRVGKARSCIHPPGSGSLQTRHPRRRGSSH